MPVIFSAASLLCGVAQSPLMLIVYTINNDGTAETVVWDFTTPGEVHRRAFKATLLAHGMSDAMAQGMVDMMAAKDEGLDNAEPRTAESTSPTGFRQWCEEVLKPAVLASSGIGNSA